MQRRNFDPKDLFYGGSIKADPEERPNVQKPTIEKTLIRKGCWMTGAPPRPGADDIPEGVERHQQQTAAIQKQIDNLREKVRKVRGLLK